MTAAPQPPSSQPLEQALQLTLQQAVAHHQAGQLQEAEHLYRAILKTRPQHPDASHNLGVLAVQSQQPAAGLPYFEAALASNPEVERYWLSYIDALILCERTDVARQMLALGKQHGLQGEAVEALAARLADKKTENSTGQPEAAKRIKPVKPAKQAKKSTAYRSAKPSVHEVNALMSLFNQGRYTDVEASARAMTEHFPHHGFGWKVLGAALKQQDRAEEALIPMQKAAVMSQGDAEAHSNLGNTLHEQGRLPEAEASLRRALKLKPNYAESHFDLGAILVTQGRLPEAEACLRRALKFKPDYAKAHNNLGVALQNLGQLDGAVACYRRALEIEPDYAEAHNNLGNALKDLGQLDNAVASYRRALEIKPDFAEAHSNLLFALSFHSGEHGEEILAVCREYDKRFCLPHREEWQAHSNSREANRRLRIGYVSPDFRRHAVALFAEPILANHDKTQVEIFCYAEVKREDEVTGRFRQFADHWYSTVGLSDDAVAKMIRDHQIDILVDLAGHTAGNRLLIFARKPAPIQLTYLGYPGTTGLSAMDYRITDHHADPEGVADACYTERLLRLPDSLCCYRPTADMPEPSVLPALSRGYLTFGSFNNFNKIDPPTLALWAALLRALPTSRLMMLTVPEGESRLRLTHRFAELGINSQRLEFHGKLPTAEFHRKFQEVDIALDPVSVSGGTTTCESLWMGVPVMALVGERFITRVSYSFLSTAGFADFAAFSSGDYIRIAVHLADNLPLLAEIRTGLRAHLATTPLPDEVAFTRNLEKLYREIWGKWCSTT